MGICLTYQTNRLISILYETFQLFASEKAGCFRPDEQKQFYHESFLAVHDDGDSADAHG